jgi:hypothetical protein
MKKILYGLAMLAMMSIGAALAQTKIDPTQQINWPLITGSGAPSISCTAVNYGQPYQNTAVTPNTFYTCGTDGWALRGGNNGGGHLLINGRLVSVGTSGKITINGGVL